MRRLAVIGAMVGLLAVVASCGGSKAASSTTTIVTTATTGLGISTTTVPTFKGSKDSKFCSVARQFSQISGSTASPDLKTLFQQFDAYSAQFIATLPAEIKGDGDTVVNDLKQLETAVKAVNYDVTKVNPSALAILQDPKFTAAAARLNAYGSQVCGLGPTST